jgi:hypothetical protein
MKTRMNETFAAHYNDICRYIAHSAFEKIKKELQDDEWDDEDIWLNAIFNMVVEINNGESKDVIAHKIFNEFLLVGYEVEICDLRELVNLINSLCKQELLAVHIAGMAFELGATPEIALARVREILSL